MKARGRVTLLLAASLQAYAEISFDRCGLPRRAAVQIMLRLRFLRLQICPYRRARYRREMPSPAYEEVTLRLRDTSAFWRWRHDIAEPSGMRVDSLRARV